VKGGALGTIASAALAITMIAAFLLLVFGVKLALRPADRQRGLLMVACGIIFIVNVLIWTL
jgi:drug/metabolite transporter superfamily protein YnfA